MAALLVVQISTGYSALYTEKHLLIDKYTVFHYVSCNGLFKYGKKICQIVLN